MTDVTMPQLGETVAEGTVTKWFKLIGEVIVKGEPLFEVSTDKVDTEIPAPASGILSEILVPEGETVDVGTVLAVIANDETTDINRSRSSPITTPSSADSSPNEAIGDSTKLSPVVRRLLEDHKLVASDVAGTGPGGRVTRDDVEAAIIARTSEVPDGRDRVIPFTKTRRITAERMVHSKSTSAHTLMVKEVDFENVEHCRRHHGATFKEREGFTLTYLPFISMAVLDALVAFPQINASVGDNELIVHRDLNLGIAVDLDEDGLVVPVIRQAGDLDLLEMARRIRRVAEEARAKKLSVDDLSGATFTITNPGPYGTLLTGAIINQPQIAILATDGVTRKPVVVAGPQGDESITIHSVGLLTLTFDHRAIDGATAARFLAHVDGQLNGRDWIHELKLA
jgi:pyruvate dehydrogenase E2 component (dihydrolipoamide acetyltransferase)